MLTVTAAGPLPVGRPLCRGLPQGRVCSSAPQEVALPPPASAVGASSRARVFPPGPCFWRRPAGAGALRATCTSIPGLTPGSGRLRSGQTDTASRKGQRPGDCCPEVLARRPDGLQRASPTSRPTWGRACRGSLSSTACLSLLFKACEDAQDSVERVVSRALAWFPEEEKPLLFTGMSTLGFSRRPWGEELPFCPSFWVSFVFS